MTNSYIESSNLKVDSISIKAVNKSITSQVSACPKG